MAAACGVGSTVAGGAAEAAERWPADGALAGAAPAARCSLLGSECPLRTADDGHGIAAALEGARAAVYRRRRPERTVLYRTVQTPLATWLELTCDRRQSAAGPAPIEREFRRYLECGILANGFARARCAECGHDFLIAWSCKGRGVCPACNTRRMVETAAHLADHVLPRLPVRPSSTTCRPRSAAVCCAR